MFYNFKSPNYVKKCNAEMTPDDIFHKYRGQCVATDTPMTIVGLAKAFGFSDLKQFRQACDTNPIYTNYVFEIQGFYEEHLLKAGSSGAQFALTSMFGWKKDENPDIFVDDENELKNLSTEQLRKMLI